MVRLSGGLAAAASVDEVVDLVAGHLLVVLPAQAFALLVAETGRVRRSNSSLSSRHRFPDSFRRP
ncbi:hypothetical protein [Streptomyces sp. NPDC004008]